MQGDSNVMAVVETSESHGGETQLDRVECLGAEYQNQSMERIRRGVVHKDQECMEEHCTKGARANNRSVASVSGSK